MAAAHFSYHASAHSTPDRVTGVAPASEFLDGLAQ
jgi:hypothetical protein